jgi:hypothetical protein
VVDLPSGTFRSRAMEPARSRCALPLKIVKVLTNYFSHLVRRSVFLIAESKEAQMSIRKANLFAND